jgi:hypothetical protein
MNTPEQRIDPTRANDEQERKAIEDIRKRGVHLLHVFDSEGNDPEFSYTVGLWHTHHHPEVIIVGLKEDLRHILLNNLNHEIGKGRVFTDGLSATDVLDGYTCYFQELPKDLYREYLGWDRWFYGGDEFEAVQMLWPNIHGVYPWDKNASENLQWQQTVLTKKPLIVS